MAPTVPARQAPVGRTAGALSKVVPSSTFRAYPVAMEASLTAGWGEFYVAIGGAGAALAGLVMVGISINLDQILAQRALPARAAAAIGSLILVVMVAGVGLIPGQPAWILGLEILAGTLVASAQHGIAIARMASEAKNPGPTLAGRSVLAAPQLVPLIIGSILLITSTTSGLYWVAAGMLLLIIGSVLAAWVLLIEIRR